MERRRQEEEERRRREDLELVSGRLVYTIMVSFLNESPIAYSRGGRLDDRIRS